MPSPDGLCSPALFSPPPPFLLFFFQVYVFCMPRCVWRSEADIRPILNHCLNFLRRTLSPGLELTDLAEMSVRGAPGSFTL